MKIATWNVNSLNVRLPQVLDWCAKESPDILALQETKVVDEKFPRAEFQAAGYHVLCSGQPTYNGVALVSRIRGSDVVTDMPGLADPQRRVLAASYDGLRVINLYVPNGESVESDKYRYKLDWLTKLAAWLRAELARQPKLVVLGDFNIAPEPRDVHNPKAWEGTVLFSEPERAALRGLVDLGLHDAFRLFEQPEQSFSWWDYRRQAFKRNNGLRIDHILASADLREVCTACRIDKGPRSLERPSDHAPVVAEFRVA